MADEGERTQGIPVDRTVSWTGSYAAGPPASPAPSFPPSAPRTHPPAPPVGRPGGARGPLVLAGALLLGLLGGLGGGYAAVQLDGDGGPRVVEAMPVSPASSSRATPITTIARAALPSVVFISVDGVGDEGAGAGVGSGFVIREDGYLVTNAHVVSAATAGEGRIEVQFADGERVDAEVVGSDQPYDIAVLKVDREGLQPLVFGDSEALLVGSEVVAVGAPLGLDSTVTSGIVSAVNRPVTAGDPANPTFINAIQTDAAINPGNSGGPLLDLGGRVVGVNSALAQLPDAFATSPGGSIGLGFAIPAAQVERTATQLIETGTSDHPVIGVLVDLGYSGEGARVLRETEDGSDPVVQGGPADRAGVRPGEIILQVGGRRIDDSNHLIITLRSYQVGDTVEVVVRDGDGQERTVSMTLQGSGQ